MDNNQQAFFELLRAGLWEKETQLSKFENIDYAAIMRLAEEQSLMGLITAGLELVLDVKVPQAVVLQFAGSTMQIEQRNKAMNDFVAKLIDLLCKNDVYAILVKGQGIAQCYEKPLWRSCGDIDLLLNKADYERTKELLLPLASYTSIENKYKKHIELHINGISVELHGSLHAGISNKIDKGLDEIQEEAFTVNKHRVWCINETEVWLPDPNTDVVYVFCHILQHFFKGGIGLRQICDWTRLLWKYKDVYDIDFLTRKLCKLGIISEWKVFSALAIEYLGAEPSVMPLYSSSKMYKSKAQKVLDIILEAGNFGQNKDQSYRSKYSYPVRTLITFWRRVKEFYTLISVFPLDSPRFFVHYVLHGIKLPI